MEPLAVRPRHVSLAFPVFAIVMLRVLLCPTETLPNVRLPVTRMTRVGLG